MPSAIVTGSSTGIGRAVALRLARQGYSVVVNSRSDTSGGRAVAEEIEKNGGEAFYVNADVSSESGVAEVFQRGNDRFGTLHVLVNNAGATRTEEFGRWSEGHWHDMLYTNLVTSALMSQAFAVQLPDTEGAIVNIASIRGIPKYARIGAAAYSAAKAGVINLTASLARALATRITVNSISPGFVETDYMTRADQDLKEQCRSAMRIQRFITPDEIAEVVAFLSNNRVMTGENITVDGGWTVTAT